MPDLSSDQLRDISVAVVEDFLNNKTSLSAGLAKQASAHDLNVEQIKRCVEASNTITQLKLMSVAEDRTFEFPLCKFAEVMQYAAVPELEKSAGISSKVTSAVKDALGRGQAANMVASSKSRLSSAMEALDGAYANRSKDPLTQRIKTQWAKNDASEARQALADAIAEEKIRRVTAQNRIVVGGAAAGALGGAAYLAGKHISNKKADGFQKAASEQDSQGGDEAGVMHISEHEARLYLIKEAASNERALEDLDGRAEVVKESLLKLAKDIAEDPIGLDKIACVVDTDLVPAVTALVYGSAKEVRDFGSARDSLFKEAELKDLRSLQALYKEARSIVQEAKARRELQKRADVMMTGMAKEAAFSLAAKAGSGLGKVVGSTLGAVGGLAVKPVKSVAKATGEALSGAVGRNPKPLGLGAKSIGAMTTVGLNASMLGHTPGINPSSGASRDVWQALQG